MNLSRDVSVGGATAAPSRIHGEECSCLPPSTIERHFDDSPDVQRLVIMLACKLGWKGFVPAAIGMEGTQESFRSASAYIHANILSELPRTIRAAAGGVNAT
jgi:hypothetical protein